MPGYWLSEPIQKRERNNLNSVGFAGWPEPNANCKSCLYFWTSQDKESTLCLREAVEVALTRPEIDTLLIEDSKSLGSAEEGDYIRRLFLQDRDWKAELRFRGETDIPLSLEILALFKPVRHLALNKMDRRWLPLLNSFPNLLELDLSQVCLRQPMFTPLFQAEILITKIQHIGIMLTDDDDDSVQLPDVAKNRWRSLGFSLGGYSSDLSLDFSKQISQLQALKYFEFVIVNDDNVSYSDALQNLSEWIGGPTCHMSHLNLACMWFPISSASSLKLVQAIGQNRTLQELWIVSLFADLDLSTEVLPEFTKSSVHHFVLGLKYPRSALSLLG
eukprot:Nitzschia sp. Nitz4//scaffold566_size2951//1031//2115//NITZ4_009281-RA/size2951-snap-gene-0.3-mRNA-1//1//CDS//3329554633//4389//frame0